jgi:hypothetical protein
MKNITVLSVFMLFLSCNPKNQSQKDINPIVLTKIKEHIKYIQEEINKEQQVKMLICVHEKVFRDTSFVTIEYVNQRYFLDATLKEFRPAWQIMSDSLAIVGFENKFIIVQNTKKDSLNLSDFIPTGNEDKIMLREYYSIELIFVKGKFIKLRASDLQYNPFWKAFEYHNPPPVKVF